MMGKIKVRLSDEEAIEMENISGQNMFKIWL